MNTIDFGRRTCTIRRGALALRSDLRVIATCTVLTLTALAIGIAGVATGDLDLTLAQIWQAIFDPNAGFTRTVVLDWRLPRMAAAIIFGAALGAAGAIFQMLTHNPLASPDIIGFTAGSYTGGLLAIIAFGGAFSTVAAGALGGGIATAILVYLLAYRHGLQGFRLIIVGIGVSAMLSALNIYLILRADIDIAMGALVWGVGTLNGMSQTTTLIGSAIVIALLVGSMAIGPHLRQIGLGDDAAAASGVSLERTRLLATLFGVALIAVVTAAAGPIGFVSLVAPQLARRIARTAGVTIAPAAAMGALLLVSADYLAQHLLPTSLPVGIVTVVIGGSYLAYLLTAEARRGL